MPRLCGSAAGYVTTEADAKDARQKWVRLTREGRQAFLGHVAYLRQFT